MIIPYETTFSDSLGGGYRNSVISLIRLLSMLMIISCHIMQYYDLELAWWFNVGVQIFLCISGFLYGQKNIDNVTDFYNKRLKKILIPYYVMSNAKFDIFCN
jgi:peptidoglycan/LPS O-acetylase OafA/YrhL